MKTNQQPTNNQPTHQQYDGSSLSPRRLQRLREFARGAMAGAVAAHHGPSLLSARTAAPAAELSVEAASLSCPQSWQPAAGDQQQQEDSDGGASASAAPSQAASLRESLRALHSRASSRADSRRSLQRAGSGGSCADAVARLLSTEQAGGGRADEYRPRTASAAAAASFDSSSYDHADSSALSRLSGGGMTAAVAEGAIASLADAITAAAAATGRVPSCVRITLDAGMAGELLSRCGSAASGGAGGSRAAGGRSGLSRASSLAASVEQLITKVEADLVPQVGGVFMPRVSWLLDVIARLPPKICSSTPCPTNPRFLLSSRPSRAWWAPKSCWSETWRPRPATPPPRRSRSFWRSPSLPRGRCASTSRCRRRVSSSTSSTSSTSARCRRRPTSSSSSARPGGPLHLGVSSTTSSRATRRLRLSARSPVRPPRPPVPSSPEGRPGRRRVTGRSVRQPPRQSPPAPLRLPSPVTALARYSTG
jgi:hypothetical protein